MRGLPVSEEVAVAPSLATTQESPSCVVVHGMHPLRGYPVTWRLTPLAGHHKNGHHEFLVERADGHIDDDFVWQCAEKDTEVMSATAASELVKRVTRPVH
jgi:hypothetical protein